LFEEKKQIFRVFQENAKWLIQPSVFGTYFFIIFLLKVLLETCETQEKECSFAGLFNFSKH